MTEPKPHDQLDPLHQSLAAIFEPDRLERELAECEAGMIGDEPNLLKRIGAGESQAGLQLVMNRFKREALPVEREKLKKERTAALANLRRVVVETETKLVVTAKGLQAAMSLKIAAVVEPVVGPLLDKGAAPDFGGLAMHTSDWIRAATLLGGIDLNQRDYSESTFRGTYLDPEHSPLVRRARRLLKIGEEFFQVKAGE